MNLLLSILIGGALWLFGVGCVLRFLSIGADKLEQSDEDAADSVRGKLEELELKTRRVRALTE